ncbi:MAG TPA: polysaccharide deacetylase family protein [Candidatus Omnitrophica bacterium]|nr:polysaccharide deacetylase family protein [Candidatus Omnitrophota bacterium]
MKKRIFMISLVIVVLVLLNIPVRSAYVAPILMYHKIDAAESLISKIAISPETFQRQMEFLYRNKYNVIPLTELIELISKGEKIPHNTVCITFDDGYENNYTKAFPILEEYNLPATIFIIVDFVGKPGYLSRRQLKELGDSKTITLGSHTSTHPVLTKIDKKYFKKEIVDSKGRLDIRVAKSVELFSYPLGAFDENVRKAVIDAGYSGAVVTNLGKDYPRDDIYALRRVRISESSANMFVFWIETSGYYTFIKERRDD